jgi:pimeloyl-ACP methyl ester carboxylesterase
MTETIVMIHGMWVSFWRRDKYKTFFDNKGYRCVTPVLRCHDMSPTSLPDPQCGDYEVSQDRDLADTFLRITSPRRGTKANT